MTGDAKGQPVQSNHPSHGSAPCLIRRIMVGSVRVGAGRHMAYSREEVKAITDKVLDMAKADAVEVSFPAASDRRRATPTPRSRPT